MRTLAVARAHPIKGEPSRVAVGANIVDASKEVRVCLIDGQPCGQAKETRYFSIFLEWFAVIYQLLAIGGLQHPLIGAVLGIDRALDFRQTDIARIVEISIRILAPRRR